jgi:mono/diheme cytochrome c family protein
MSAVADAGADPRFAPAPDAAPLLRALGGGLAGALAFLVVDLALRLPGGAAARPELAAAVAAAAGGGADPGRGAPIVIVAGMVGGLCYVYGRFRRFVPGGTWAAGLAWGAFMFVLGAPLFLPFVVAVAPPESAAPIAALVWGWVAVGKTVVACAAYGLVVAAAHRVRRGLLAALLAAGAAGCAIPATATPWRPPLEAAGTAGLPGRVSSAAEGEALFRGFCVECHGHDGRGDPKAARLMRPPPPDFTDPRYMSAQVPEYYYRAIREGITGTSMPRWDHLFSEDQTWNLVFYLFSLGAPEGSREGAALAYERACSRCHGAGGDGVEAAPLASARRAGQSRADLAADIAARHPALAAGLSARDRAAVVEAVFGLLYEPMAGPGAPVPGR